MGEVSTATGVTIHGATGRMGTRLVALAAADRGLDLVAAATHAGDAQVGRDAGEMAAVGPIGVAVTGELTPGGEVVIDFSVAEAAANVAMACAVAGSPVVVGTTGLTAEAHAALKQAAGRVPVLVASNFSLVVNVMHALARRAAAWLGEGYDVELLEAHHRFKRDAPSGTAIALAQTVCEASGRSFDEDVVFARHGDDAPRQPSDLTIQTLRLGDHPGEHTLFFAGPGERLELKHVGTSRDSYAIGALRAAKWLAGKPAGMYDVADALGLGGKA
ncbi:MAG: 4-hydroxy-tetrahydrodipicolinate reductase [Planctomycetota bacterium]